MNGQSFGLIRSWEQPEVIEQMKSKPPAVKIQEEKKQEQPAEKIQNYIFKRGNRLFILNKKYKGI